MIRYLLALWISLVAFQASAQVSKPDLNDNWRKRLKTAEALYLAGDYGSAAAYFQSVLMEKPTKTDIAYKAATSYLYVRDYENASNILSYIKDKNSEFENIGYKYALSLKKLGKYPDAIREFEYFLESYQGPDPMGMEDKIETEIQGCRFAMEATKKEDLELEYLSQAVNSGKDEFAPIPFANEVLYFTSNFEGNAQIYRSLKKGGSWTVPKTTSIFQGMEKDHYGNGVFTPDRQRFYFTQCDKTKEGEYICDLYMIKKKGKGWTTPEKLPDYINAPSVNTTHPSVVVIDNKEVIYFASNRQGGQGGMDIWYVVRDYNSTDFSLPVNLGPTINTPEDEITPFYESTKGTLYFSSNGHPNVGGFDIFKAEGREADWAAATHLGLPINSSADDTYYVLLDDMKSGYFVSNRTYKDKKTVTTDDDIFRFVLDDPEVVVKGNISDEEGELLGNVSVSLYEVNMVGDAKLLNTRIFPGGQYQFLLLAGKQYQIEAEKMGFESMKLDINAREQEPSHDLILTRKKVVISERPPGPGGNIEIEPSAPEVEEPEIVMVDRPEPEPTKPPAGRDRGEIVKTPPVKPTLPPAKPVEEEIEPVVKPERRPVTTNQQVTDGQVFTVVGEKALENLTTEEIRAIVYVDGKRYIRNQDGTHTKIVLESTTTRTETVVSSSSDLPELDVNPIDLGTNYKIQLAAVRTFKESKFEDTRSIGDIQLEEIDGGITRVFIAPFSTERAAKDALLELVDLGYERAFIIRYENGVRKGRAIRSWDID